MVGYRPARGLCTLLTDPDLVGRYLLENLCKGHVASICNHTSVVWYGACATSHGGFKVLRGFYAACGGSVHPLQSVRLID
jgi:hypothetical protein